MGRIICITIFFIFLTTSCVYLPKTVTKYDEKCQITVKHMELQGESILFNAATCQNEGCLALLVAAGFVSAASVVVSGSVVIAGNMIYWYEKQGQCQEVADPAGQPD